MKTTKLEFNPNLTTQEINKLVRLERKLLEICLYDFEDVREQLRVARELKALRSELYIPHKIDLNT
jgi:hypothetical protein